MKKRPIRELENKVEYIILYDEFLSIIVDTFFIIIILFFTILSLEQGWSIKSIILLELLFMATMFVDISLLLELRKILERKNDPRENKYVVLRYVNVGVSLIFTVMVIYSFVERDFYSSDIFFYALIILLILMIQSIIDLSKLKRNLK
jgi:hypothetical protein